jgi:hypothetical protein
LTSLTAALIISIPVALLWDPPTSLPSWTAIGAIAALGILGTGVALSLLLLADSQRRRAAYLNGDISAVQRAILGMAGFGEPVLPNAL